MANGIAAGEMDAKDPIDPNATLPSQTRPFNPNSQWDMDNVQQWQRQQAQAPSGSGGSYNTGVAGGTGIPRSDVPPPGAGGVVLPAPQMGDSYNTGVAGGYGFPNSGVPTPWTSGAQAQQPGFARMLMARLGRY